MSGPLLPLLAASLLVFAAAREAAVVWRVGPVRQQSPAWGLGAALAGLAILALALGQAPPWSARAALELLAICVAAPPLAASARRGSPHGFSTASGLAPAMLLAAAGALAAACSPLGLAPAAGAVAGPGLGPGAGLGLGPGPGALPPVALLAVHASGGLALGLLLVALAELGAERGLGPGSQGGAALAAAAALLLLAALPGLGRFTVGGGFGLPVAAAEDPSGAWPAPLLTEVTATLPAGGDQGRVLLAADIHRLPLRLPVSGLEAALGLAALLLALALLIALLPVLLPGVLGARAMDGTAARPGSPLRPGRSAAGVCLVLGSGLLLLAGLAVLLSGTLPPVPFPAAGSVAAWLEGQGPWAQLPADARLSVAQVPAELVRFTPMGAGLDLAALLVAGGVAGAGGLALLRPGGAQACRDPRSVELLLELAVAGLAVALLATSWVDDRWWLAGWSDGSRGLLLAVALGLGGLARFVRANRRPGLAAALLALAGAALLIGTVAAGRGGLPPVLIDTLAVF